MAGMLEYKCPCCDGAIQFDSATQKMKCPYCDTEFDVDTLKGYDEELKDEKPSEMEWTTPGGSWAEGETAGLHTYSCKSCGGEIVGDDTMAASACPFCGNPIVLTGQFAGALRPDLIIPFKLDKKAAKAKLQEHLKGKTLLPRVFRSQNHIDEIKGVYVPFWLFDSDADAQLRFTAIPDAFLFEALFSRPVSLLGKFSFLSLSANRIQQGMHLRTIFFTVAFSFLVRCTFRIYFY